MSGSIVQSTSIVVGGDSPGTGLTATLSSTTEGNAIVLIFSDASGLNPSFSDNVNGTYTQLNRFTFNDGTFTHSFQAYLFLDGAGGTLTIQSTAEVFFFGGFLALEVNGPGSGTFAEATATSQIAPVVGTNVLSVGPPSTNNTVPSFVIGSSGCLGSTDVQTTAGTGYTNYTGEPSYNSNIVFANITAPSTAVLFSVPTDGSETYLMIDIVLGLATTSPSLLRTDGIFFGMT